MKDLKNSIKTIANNQPLSERDAFEAFELIFSGSAHPVEVAGLITALHLRGETTEQIVSAANVLKSQMLPVHITGDAIDIVGTGGDNSHSYNISTASAFVVAGGGVKVAKHGNRAVTSSSGAADILQALGINIDLSPSKIGQSIEEVGLGFMFAPNHHRAMGHVAPIRMQLGIRTIFNLLGPLVNPANVDNILLGVYGRKWVEPMAEAAKKLGKKSAWVVYGNGMDELTTCGTSHIAQLRDGEITTFSLTPEDVGLAPAALDAFRGGDKQENARALRDILNGAHNAYRDIVLLNSAAAFLIAGKTQTLKEGIALARDSIDSGKAAKVLQHLVEFSQEEPSHV